MSVKRRLERLELEANEIARRKQQTEINALFDDWETEELKTLIAYFEEDKINELPDTIQKKLEIYQENYLRITRGKRLKNS